MSRAPDSMALPPSMAGTRAGTDSLANGRRSESPAGGDGEEGAALVAAGRRLVLLYPSPGTGQLVSMIERAAACGIDSPTSGQRREWPAAATHPGQSNRRRGIKNIRERFEKNKLLVDLMAGG